MSTQDLEYMAEALRLAERGLYSTHPNPRVGCVLVKDDQIVGRGWHQKAGEAHAEINALADAGNQARGATAYVSLEPCCHQGKTPPCCDALIAAGVSHVVAAMQDPNPAVSGQGMARLQAAGISTPVGVLEQAARDLNPGFIKRMESGQPYVRCKSAMSLDGRTAMASGESKWITSAAARADVHRLRARSSAIVTGVATVNADDPSLTARLGDIELAGRQPLRVVVDSNFSMSANANILSQPGETLVVGAVANEAQQSALEEKGATTEVMPGADGKIDLAALVAQLAERECNELMVEAGPTLTGAFLQAGLVDELVIYMAPKLLGDNARGLFKLPGLDSMADQIQLDIGDLRQVGDDLRIIARVVDRSAE